MEREEEKRRPRLTPKLELEKAAEEIKLEELAKVLRSQIGDRRRLH